jgi:integrase
MTNASFKIVIRKDRPKKDGQFPICLRVIIGRKPKLIPFPFSCFDKDFDSVKEIVKKSDPLHYQKNLLLQKAVTKANIIKYDFANRERILSLTEFEKVFKNENYGSKSFYTYIEELIEKRDNILSNDTILFYRKQLSKLRKFKPELIFNDVNDCFVEDYKKYMIHTLKNKEITWQKGLEFLKRICNSAFIEKKINEHPLRNLKIKRPKGDTKHLTIDELNKLQTLYQSGDLQANLQNVLRYFLFACFTGMRYQDVKDLRFTHIKKIDTRPFLDFIQHKTKKESIIPVFDQVNELLPEKQFEQQKVFRVKCNQDTNRKLKEIMIIAEIGKRITFHSARHTCSNALYGLNTNIDTRSMILGDTKEVINNHYTEQNLNLSWDAMDKYSKVLKKQE